MILQSARHPICPLCQLSRSRLRAVVKLGNASTIQINVNVVIMGINLATLVLTTAKMLLRSFYVLGRSTMKSTEIYPHFHIRYFQRGLML